MEIFNKDVTVLGDLTINPVNGAGDILVKDGTNVIKYRTVAELFNDMSVVNDKNYVHDQASPSAVWNITHNLGKNAAPIVVDSAGTVVVGQIDYIDENNITLTFNGAFSGYAYFN